MFTDVNIYLPFARSTPQFGIIALALTFVVLTGEIELVFRSFMALETAAFCLSVQAGVPWPIALVLAFATGAACDWVNVVLLVITIGTSFLFRGLKLVLMWGTAVPLTADLFPALHAIFREPLFGVPIQTLWRVVVPIATWILCSTGPGSARLCFWSATTRSVPG